MTLKINYGSWFSKKSKILNDQLTTNSYIAGQKFFLHRILQVLNYHLSQEPEFSRQFWKKQLRIFEKVEFSVIHRVKYKVGYQTSNWTVSKTLSSWSIKMNQVGIIKMDEPSNYCPDLKASTFLRPSTFILSSRLLVIWVTFKIK